MASVSTTQTYTIDGNELSVYPTSCVVSDNLVSKSYNTMTAKFVDIPIALKQKVQWVFEYAEREPVEAIYSYIRDKIINNHSRIFTINYNSPVGWMTGEFYLGTPTSFTSAASKANGNITVWKLELHFIEIQGDILNKPVYTGGAT